MVFATRLALLCAFAFFAICPAAARTANGDASVDQILNRMREVNGGLWNAHISSTTPHQVDGQPSTLHTDTQGLRFVLHQCMGKVCLGTYFDGERLYSLNINDTALPRSRKIEPYLRALRILGTLDFLSPAFAKDGGRVDNGGTIDFEGKTCRVLLVSALAATPFAVFVDPQSGLVAGARDLQGDYIYAMHDYRRVGAFMLPYLIVRNGEPVERYVTRTIVNEPLAIPHGPIATIESRPAGMPLDLQSSIPVGNCTIGGITVRCLLDTGNSALSMSLELAERLHLSPIGMLGIAGLGQYSTEVVHAGPLQLGNVRLSEANYVVLHDIHDLGYDIVLGADALASMPVTIDYARHALYFDQRPGPGGITVPISFEDFIPVVSVTLGETPARLAIDTGDQSTINLAYAYYEQHMALFTPTKDANVRGVGGQSVELLGELARLRVGSLTAQNLQIGTTKILKGTADGHLGAGFLSNYRLTLDYAHERMTLVPATPP